MQCCYHPCSFLVFTLLRRAQISLRNQQGGRGGERCFLPQEIPLSGRKRNLSLDRFPLSGRKRNLQVRFSAFGSKAEICPEGFPLSTRKRKSVQRCIPLSTRKRKSVQKVFRFRPESGNLSREVFRFRPESENYRQGFPLSTHSFSCIVEGADPNKHVATSSVDGLEVLTLVDR